MSNTIRKNQIEDDYLNYYFASDNPTYELLNSQIVTMSPPSLTHIYIVGDLFGEIREHLKKNKNPCSVFAENRALKINENNPHYSKPDLMVECEIIDEKYAYNPVLIAEVLSKDRKKDLVTKFEIYKQIDSLMEYAVIEQTTMQVIVFRRKNNWNPMIYTEGSVIHFESINLKLEIEKIYSHISFDEYGKSYIHISQP